jgi:hypothetical protein
LREVFTLKIIFSRRQPFSTAIIFPAFDPIRITTYSGKSPLITRGHYDLRRLRRARDKGIAETQRKEHRAMGHKLACTHLFATCDTPKLESGYLNGIFLFGRKSFSS